MGVSISSDTADGTQVGITLEKTEADKGTVQVRKWSVGQDPQTEPPIDDQTTSLYDIRARADGSEVVCKGDVTGTDPVVTFLVTAQPPLVRVTIEGTLFGAGDGTTDYPVGDDDVKNLRRFVVDSHFTALA
jgi:hypothetical protein